MSQKRIKQFRKITHNVAKLIRKDIENAVISDMMSEKFSERIRIAWKIIRKKVEFK